MNETKRYTAALIGAGRIGMKLESDPKRLKPASHFGVMSKHTRLNFKAVCDSDKKNLQMAKEKYPEIEVFTNAEDMLKKIKPEIVSIATWKDTHYEMIKACIENDVSSIICEKPIAEKFDDAFEIVKEIEKNNIHLLINHRRRFDSLLYPIIEELSDGKIGEILQVSAFYVYGLLTTGTHVIDTLRFFLNDIAGEIIWASGFKNSFSHFSPPDDPCIDGIIGFENGLKVSIQSMDMKDYDIMNLSFYGRKGMAQLKNIGRDFYYHNVIDSIEHDGFTELSDTPVEKLGGKPRPQFTCLLDNAIDCIEGKSSSLSTGRDSLKALQVLLALKESANNNSKIINIKKF